MTRDHLIDRRTVTSAALAGGAALLLATDPTGRAAAAAAPAAAAHRDLVLTLPAPTGLHPVGREEVYLVDDSRADPWARTIPVRELMVTLFYPAARTTRTEPAPQLPPLTAELFGQIAPRADPRLPAAGVAWGTTESHSVPHAPALAGRRPALVYSPGGGDPRGLGTSLAEELASHGSLVVVVDHPGDPAAVQFPATTAYRREPYRTTVLRGDPRSQPPLFRTMIDTRTADLRFVLDRLRQGALAAGMADLRRIGVYGHSAGGSAVTEVLHESRLVRAAVNLEGYLDYPGATPTATPTPFPVTAAGADRPVLLLGTEGFEHRRELERSWQRLAARSGHWVHQKNISGANHWTVTDYAAMLPQLQAAGLLTAAARDALVGPLDPAVAIPEVRRTVREFFTRHLT